MRIILETNNLPLVLDLKSDAPASASVEMQMEGARSWGDTAQTVNALIEIAVFTGASLKWLIGKLKKHKPAKLKINGVEIHVDESTIEAVVKKLLSEADEPRDSKRVDEHK